MLVAILCQIIILKAGLDFLFDAACLCADSIDFAHNFGFVVLAHVLWTFPLHRILEFTPVVLNFVVVPFRACSPVHALPALFALLAFALALVGAVAFALSVFADVLVDALVDAAELLVALPDPLVERQSWRFYFAHLLV